MNIGFIGLGIMGKPMAGHLIASGNGGVGWDHSAMVRALEMMANHDVARAE